MNKRFEYFLKTGSNSIVDNRELVENKNQERVFSGDKMKVNPSFLTGHFSTKISANGKTLFEEYPSVENINGIDYFFINSGDYFVKSDYNNDYYFYFKETIPSDAVIIYENKDYDSGVLTYQNVTGVGRMQNTTIPDITGKIIENQPADLDEFFDTWDLFFEGEKIYQENFSNFDDETGRVFAYKKDLDYYNIYGEGIELYGTGFLENQYDLYVDGLEMSKTQLIPLYSGVTNIVTGVDGDVFIEKEKFNVFNL